MSLSLSNSLLIKMFTPLLAAFGIVLFTLVTYVPSIIEENAVSTVIPSAISTVNQYKAIRGYYTQNVVKKVLQGSELKPHFNHKGDKNRIPLPATFIHDLSKQFTDKGIMTLKLYSDYPFPNRNSRRLDDFGRAAWEELNRDHEKVYSHIDNIDGMKVVRVAVADTMNNQGCVDCHNSHPDTPKNNWRLNDVRGVLEVQVPIEQQLIVGRELNIKIATLVLSALFITLLLLVTLFRRLISNRLKEVSTALFEIADGNGDLKQRLSSSAEDEIGAITKAFNNFVEKLNHSLKQIGSQVSQLTAATGVMRSTADQSLQGVGRQQQEIDQVAAAMNEMTSTTQEIEKLAVNTADNTEKTEQEAEKSHNIVSDNMRSMEKLSAEMTAAVEEVKRLESDSQNIGGVLDVIRGIAEQTNLLALNAAIEAARAGEQGRGFAVVADEVRTLAHRTQESTREIETMIEELQQGVKASVVTIERGNDNLRLSLEQAERISQVNDLIVKAIGKMRNLNIQIATAAEEQTSVSEEMNRNISNIADVSYQSKEGAQQVLESASNINESLTIINKQLQRFTGSE